MQAWPPKPMSVISWKKFADTLRVLLSVSEERLSTDDYGNVIYRFKKPWDDGTTALKLTPMELMERLVALVPRPRVHLTR